MKDSLVCVFAKYQDEHSQSLTDIPEEFGIYLNYVRKLGFEETPDYDFLRELFTKVLKNMGEVEDGIYDWHLLAQNGKSWEVRISTAFASLPTNHVIYRPAQAFSIRRTRVGMLRVLVLSVTGRRNNCPPLDYLHHLPPLVAKGRSSESRQMPL